MSYRIQFRRGASGDRPTLGIGEPSLDTDNNEVWIGTSAGNVKIYPPVGIGTPGISGTPVANQFTYWASATEVAGLPQVTWDSGNSRFVFANTVGLQWSGRSIVTAPDDGSLRLTNSAANDAGSIIFGPSTIAFPRLKRDGVGLQARLANDTDWTTFAAGAFIGEEPYRLAEQVGVPGSIVGYGQLYCKASDSELYYMDSAGVETQLGKVQGSGVAGQVAYWDGASSVTGDTGLLWDSAANLLQFGGTTNADPALAKVAAAKLEARAADNSGRAQMSALDFIASRHLTAGATGEIGWSTSTKLSAPSDGDLLLTDNAGTSSGLLQFGGTTVNEPALRANVAQLEARLADNSARCAVLASTFFASNNAQVGTAGEFRWSSSSRLSAPSDGDLLLTDSAGTSSGLLMFGGTTVNEPALRANGAQLEARLADNSGPASFTANTIISQNALGGMRVDAAGSFYWNTRSFIKSPSDGIVLLTNNAGTDFGLLQLGGTTNAFPALARHATDTDALECRLADNSARADFYPKGLYALDNIQLGGTSDVTWSGRTKIGATVDGNIRLVDNAGTDFGLLQFGGTTSAYPAIGRDSSDTDAVAVRLADNSGYAALYTGTIAAENAFINANGVAGWSTRARFYSLADGAIELAASGGSGSACYVELNEFASGSDPAAPGANKARWFVRDNGAGKGELCVRFPSGAVQVIASEP